jgi:hypothetical protein
MAKKLTFMSDPPKTSSFLNANTPSELRDKLIKGFFPSHIPLSVMPTPQALYEGFTPVDMDTFTFTLKRFSNNSAPGPDQIQFDIWKKVYIVNPQILPNLFNPLLEFGYHSKALKKALGVILSKPDKPDYSFSSFFRIISLLQTVSKILEKYITDHLYGLSSSLGLVSPKQYFPLYSISIADAVFSLKQEVIAMQKAGMRAITLFLDIKGRFDNILPTSFTTN